MYHYRVKDLGNMKSARMARVFKWTAFGALLIVVIIAWEEMNPDAAKRRFVHKWARLFNEAQSPEALKTKVSPFEWSIFSGVNS